MVGDEGFGARVGLKAWPVLRIRCSGGLAETILSHHEEYEAHGAWRSADFRRFFNQESRNRGKGISEIEGKAARVAAKERGERLSFKAGSEGSILGHSHFMVSWLPDSTLNL